MKRIAALLFAVLPIGLAAALSRCLVRKVESTFSPVVEFSAECDQARAAVRVTSFQIRNRLLQSCR